MAAETTPSECAPCGGSGWVQIDRGAGAWEDRECQACAGEGKAVEVQPSVTDAEVEALIARAEDAAKRRAELLKQPNGEVAARVAAVLRALLAARREADARVAAAVMAEREAIVEGLRNASARGFNSRSVLSKLVAAYIVERPTPDHASSLATLLAEAREQGRREMREMAADAADRWGRPFRECQWIRPASAGGDIADCIRALPVTIPTPEAPQ